MLYYTITPSRVPPYAGVNAPLRLPYIAALPGAAAWSGTAAFCAGSIVYYIKL